MSPEEVTLAAVLAFAGGAAIVDVRTGRIPNLITAPALVLGVALAAGGITNVSLGVSLAGIAVGALLMLPGHAIGATGAGDVKLLAALGAWLGGQIVPAFLFTAMAGGLLAAVVAFRRGRLGAAVDRTRRLALAPRDTWRAIEADAPRSRFRYGPAIAVGAIIAALGM